MQLYTQSTPTPQAALLGAIARACESRGVIPPTQLKPDADAWYYLGTHEKPGSGNGRLKIHRDGLGFMIKNWAVDDKFEHVRLDGRPMPADLRDVEKKLRDGMESVIRTDAAHECSVIWHAAQPARADHPYLVAKRVGFVAGALREIWTYPDAVGFPSSFRHKLVLPILVVPHLTGNSLTTLTYITSVPHAEEGWVKRCHRGGRKTGTCVIVNSVATETPGPIYLAEGVATAATIANASGRPAIVSFDADNMLQVARDLVKHDWLKKKGLQLVVCGDDDAHLLRKVPPLPNKGAEKAIEAAHAAGALLAVPDFSGLARGDRDSDLNDVEKLGGLARVQACLAAAAPPPLKQRSNGLTPQESFGVPAARPQDVVPFDPFAAAHQALVIEQGQALRPVIRIAAGEISRIADEAEGALIAANAQIYTRQSGLVRPISDTVRASDGRKTSTPRLVEVSDIFLNDMLSRIADFEGYDARSKGYVRKDPPSLLAPTLNKRAGHWRFRPIVGLIATQTMRPDGSLLTAQGYDEQTGLLLWSPPEMPAIPDRPSRDDALAAWTLLWDLLRGFPHVADCDRGTAVSAIMTPVLRGAFTTAPAHVIRARTAGTGKSYKVDLASLVAVGEVSAAETMGPTREEIEKRIGAALIGAQPIISLDNLEGEIEGALICQMITQPIVSVRRLGASELVKVPNNSTFFLNGNNIKLKGDLARRCINSNLDANMERPELRFRDVRPDQLIRADRGKYVAAVLTIARAYTAAGRPMAAQLSPLGSFEEWSHLVRGAIVWLAGMGWDPVATMQQNFDEDPERIALGGFLAKLQQFQIAHTPQPPNAFVPQPPQMRMTAQQILVAADSDHDLREALNEIMPIDFGPHSSNSSKAKSLGKWLAKIDGTIIGGRKLRRWKTGDRPIEWGVETVRLSNNEQIESVSSVSSVGLTYAGETVSAHIQDRTHA